jgi:hypothetical protein
MNMAQTYKELIGYTYLTCRYQLVRLGMSFLISDSHFYTFFACQVYCYAWIPQPDSKYRQKFERPYRKLSVSQTGSMILP